MGAESPPKEPSPKIVIVDESPIRAAILEEGLREAGFTNPRLLEVPAVSPLVLATKP